MKETLCYSQNSWVISHPLAHAQKMDGSFVGKFNIRQQHHLLRKMRISQFWVFVALQCWFWLRSRDHSEGMVCNYQGRWWGWWWIMKEDRRRERTVSAACGLLHAPWHHIWPLAAASLLGSPVNISTLFHSLGYFCLLAFPRVPVTWLYKKSQEDV